MLEEITIIWPDTGQIEIGTKLDETEDQVLMKSDFDSTVNWIPKKYLKQ